MFVGDFQILGSPAQSTADLHQHLEDELSCPANRPAG